MKIRVYLSEESIDDAIRRLEEYTRWLDSRTKLLCERLAERGIEVASVEFGSAIYDGTNDVSVFLEDAGNGMRIVASGQTVCFIEFGTGVTFQTYHPKRYDAGVGDVGTFGHGLGRLNNGWRYPESHGAGSNATPDPKHKGYLHTYGNPANMPMYNASKDMRSELTRIAREVFGTS